MAKLGQGGVFLRRNPRPSPPSPPPLMISTFFRRESMSKSILPRPAQTRARHGLVSLVVRAPGARQVAVTGDFTHWSGGPSSSCLRGSISIAS